MGAPGAVTVRAWVLNLDAEDELARGARTTPSRVERARIAAMTARLRGALVPDGDLILGDPPARLPAGCEGVAWCPTPGALARLRDAGATLPHAPPFAVLRAVNHRAWAAGLGLHLPGARWVADPDALARCLDAPWPEHGWLLKRPYTCAGRGRIHLRARAERDDPRARGWLARTLADGGLLAEPWVHRVLDLGLHGHLARGGALARGGLTRAVVDDRGQWLRTENCDEDLLSRSEIDAVYSVFEESAAALRAAGYSGPFGVDAYVWEGERGRRVQPRSEVNARYSMGWAVGMGARRPDLSSR